MKQKLIITALPNGLTTRGISILKASAAISLQVEDAGANTTLQNVPDMLHWAELVQKGKFIVQLNGSTVEAKVVSKPVDTVLWKNLFASTVKVRSFVQEDLSNMPIVSYPVKHIVGYIKGIAEQVGKNFANDLPDSNFYTENPIFTAISDYSVGDFPNRNGREKISLDKIAINNQTGLRLKRTLNKNKAIPFSPTANPGSDFAQLKNFHGLYNASQVPTFKQVDKPDFEFHDIFSILAGYPQLMRKLGLVFDFEFVNPGNVLMKVGTDPTIRIIPTGIDYSIPTTISCPLTAYAKTTMGFYAKAETGSLIDKGHLKINSDAFTVFQVDTDGAALKLCQQVDALQLKKATHIFYAAEGGMPNAAAIPFYNNEAPRKEGTPSHRTAGIAVAKNGMAALLQKKFNRMNQLKASLISPGTAPSGVSGTNSTFILTNEILFADDINLGYRMDVQPQGGKWFSLHKRNNSYSFLNSSATEITIPDMPVDEGYISIGAAEEQTTDGKQLKVGEAIARWQGWSLSVPRPGSALNDPMLDKQEMYDKNKPADKIKEENKYKTPGTTDFKLNIRPGIEKGSLPMLRFGKKYSLKIRTVDLAGNSVDNDFTPENSGEAISGNIRYTRYEPVDAPFLLLGTDTKDGESSEVIVIRSNEKVSVADYEANNKDSKHVTSYSAEAVRYVKPPRCTVEMATTHAMLDAGFGEANKTKAIDYYQKIISSKDPEFKAEDATSKLKVFDGTGSQKAITVEYLADPMAAGVSFFISANDPNPKLPDPEILSRRVSFFFDDEVTSDALANKTPTVDEWFNPKTFRIVVKEGPPGIKWDSSSRTLNVAMMKGVIFKMNYACFWRPDDLLKHSGVLEMMGMSNLAGAVGQRIAKGQHWMFSPWREITCVHAVQQPISEFNGIKYPQIATLIPDRDYGENTASLHTKLLVHGPTSDKLDIEADWIEYVDDVTTPGPDRYPMHSKVFHFTSFYLVFEYVFGEIVKGNPFGPVKHLFNDTKHRIVNYKSIASTRYREYFYQLIADKGDAFKLTTESTVVPKVNILSSARPAAPQVEYVIPTFEWDRNVKPAITISGRASGLRIYMKRPWFSSGEGEQLAVILRVPSVYNPTVGQQPIPGPSVPVTTWGTDPTKMSAPVPGGIYPDQNTFINVKSEDKDSALAVVENPNVKVNIVAFDVRYDKDRQLYYADVMLNINTSYFPFVRLALARYQKDSIRKGGTDCCLSAIFETDYIQVPPPRLSSVQFGSSKNSVTVSISGTIPTTSPSPEVVTRVEFIIEPLEVPSSEGAHITLQTRPIDSYSHILIRDEVKNFGFLHSHVFNLAPEYATRPYRVKVLEYEMITYDDLKPNPNPGGQSFSSMPRKDRLVFAEVYEVNK